jgi:hypothetical protein
MCARFRISRCIACTKSYSWRAKEFNILWHVDPLLGNDREISNYTTAVTRQRPVNSNRGMMFSVRSLPKCYKQDKLELSSVSWLVSEWVRGLLLYSRELWLLEAGIQGRRQFGNPEEGTVHRWSHYQVTSVKTWLCTLVCVCNSVL